MILHLIFTVDTSKMGVKISYSPIISIWAVKMRESQNTTHQRLPKLFVVHEATANNQTERSLIPSTLFSSSQQSDEKFNPSSPLQNGWVSRLAQIA